MKLLKLKSPELKNCWKLIAQFAGIKSAFLGGEILSGQFSARILSKNLFSKRLLAELLSEEYLFFRKKDFEKGLLIKRSQKRKLATQALSAVCGFDGRASLPKSSSHLKILITQIISRSDNF